MSPEVFQKWENIIEDVEKTKIPVEFVKKLILKLTNRRQKTINVKNFLDRGMDSLDIEDAIAQQLEEYDHEMISIEFVLDIQGIADAVQPETDKILKNL